MIRMLLLLLALLLPALAAAADFSRRQEVQDFIAEMSDRHGFDRGELEAAFRKTHPLPAVIKAIRPPADPGIRSWQAYRARFIEPRRLAAGRRFMHDNAVKLTEAEARFGVPASVIAAIIGVETLYGKVMGRFNTFAALSTLSFDYPPRAELFRRELEELLLLAREEGRNPLDYRGSYAGALGLPQFLPSSRRRWGLDFDGDGRITLDDSVGDAIGSVANFLADHGWKKGDPIADTVKVSGPGIQAMLDEGIAPRRLPSEWSGLGVLVTTVGADDTAQHIPGSGLAALPAALIDLTTPRAPTEYRAGYTNFFVITRYNRSSFYAATVMDFASELTASE